MWEAVERDIYHPSVEWLLRDLLRHIEQNGAIGRIAMGCAVKPTMPLVGKKKPNRRRKLKQAQAAPRDNQIRAINIARGASGSVLFASPLFPERLGLIFGSTEEHFCVSQRK